MTHIINITKRFAIPMYFNGELVLSRNIGNSIGHKYIVYPDNKVKFIRWSDKENKFIEVKEGGPEPKLGDNIWYEANGYNTKWNYTKLMHMHDFTIGTALWNAGLAHVIDETDWYWAEEGDGKLDNEKMTSWDRSMNFNSQIERMNKDEFLYKDYYTMSWKRKVYMAWDKLSFKGNNNFEYIIATPRFFVANATYKEEIKASIKECLNYLLDEYVQIGTIRETKISGMYLPPQK